MTKENESHHLGPIGLIVASLVSFLAWLIFILFFALYWSEGFSLFQNIIVFIVSLCIMGVIIGLMWIVWGRNKNGNCGVKELMIDCTGNIH